MFNYENKNIIEVIHFIRNQRFSPVCANAIYANMVIEKQKKKSN